MKPVIVPGTRELIAQLPGAFPHGARTLVGLLEDKPIGMVGIYPERGRFILFAVLTARAKRFPREILRTGRTMLATVEHVRAPVYAKADPRIYGSVRLLEHLGFEQMAPGTYARLPHG